MNVPGRADRQLALAVHRGHAVRVRLPVAAGPDETSNRSGDPRSMASSHLGYCRVLHEVSRQHESDPTTAQSGPEPLARQHHARPARQRHAQALHRRALGDGAHLESDDLRPRHQEQHRLRRRHPREARRTASRARSCSSSWRSKTSPGPPTCFGRSTTGPTAWTAGCRWKCRRCWPTTRPAPWPRPRTCTPARARPNLFIKIPGTKEGLPAIEEAIFAGVPVNVTLLFSREQYLAAAEAFLRGIERRIDAGLNPDVGSVASVFISRWDAAVDGQGARRRCATSSASPSPSGPTRPTATCSTRRAGSASSTPAPVRSACCGPAREPRTPRPPTFCTSRPWPRRSP